MIKSILLALDGSEHSHTASQYALWLAEHLQATVTGLHVIDVVSIEGSGSFLHDISGSLGFEPYLDFSSKMREALHDRGRTLLDGFLAMCRSAAFAPTSSSRPASSPTRSASRRAPPTSSSSATAG